MGEGVGLGDGDGDSRSSGIGVAAAPEEVERLVVVAVLRVELVDVLGAGGGAGGVGRPDCPARPAWLVPLCPEVELPVPAPPLPFDETSAPSLPSRRLVPEPAVPGKPPCAGSHVPTGQMSPTSVCATALGAPIRTRRSRMTAALILDGSERSMVPV